MPHDEPQPRRSRIRFGLRALTALVITSAFLFAWWADHRRLQQRIDRLQVLNNQLSSSARIADAARNLAIAEAELIRARTKREGNRLNAEIERLRASPKTSSAAPQ